MSLSSALKCVTILSLMTSIAISYPVNAAYHPMAKIYQIASKGTKKSLNTLKNLTKEELNVSDKNGNSAVCQAVIEHNYAAFNVLKQAGANLKAHCLNKISPEQIREFNAGYSNWARSGNYTNLKKRETSPYAHPWEQTTGLSVGTSISLAVGTAALVGGGIAIFNDDDSDKKSDNGSSGEYDNGQQGIGNTIPVISENPSTYQTDEFKKGNFAEQINLDNAYANFSKAKAEGNLETGTANFQPGAGVKVGILDNGTDINHPDLAATIVTNSEGKRYGYNFDYGPCRNGDTTNCYGIKERPGVYTTSGPGGDFVFYKTGADDYDVLLVGNEEDGYYSQLTIDLNFLGYADDYDWDKLKNDPTSHDLLASMDYSEIENTSSADHGTHVAGIVGANMNGSGMHGVAPFATLVPGIFDPRSFGYGFETALKTYAQEGVRVVNMSFGVPAESNEDTVNYAVGKDANEIFAPKEIEGYKIAAQNDIVLVRAAGNDGNGLAASIDNGAPLTTMFDKGSEYDLTNLFITVVSVNSGNSLASYSQTCGAAQGYCLSAPGGDMAYGRDEALAYAQDMYNRGEWTYEYANDWYHQYQLDQAIYSTVQNDSTHKKNENGLAYGYMQGTSMATPVVSGSVALLMSAYPHLTSQQVVEILFRTANKNLVGWVDDGTWSYTDSNGTVHTLNTSATFGHGMIDLDKASQPLGTLNIPTGNTTASAQIPMEGTRLRIPFQIYKIHDLPTSKTIVALDEYDRGYSVPTSVFVSGTQRNSEAFKKSFRSFLKRNQKSVGVPEKLSFAFTTSSVSDDNLGGMGAIDMRMQLNAKNALTLKYRSDVLAEENTFDQALSNPFIDMRESYGFSHIYNMNKKLSLSFDATVGKNGFYDVDTDLEEEFNRSVQAFTSEISYKPKSNLTLRAIGGMLNEKDSILGLNGAGAFDTETSQTYYTGAVIEYVPVKPLVLSASYYYGRSEMNNSSSSMVSFQDVISDSFSFDAKYNFDDKKMLGLQFSSPLRIRSGSAHFNIPVGRDMYTDTVYREEFDISLKPTAREYDLALYYMHETDNYDWRGALMTRFNPDHDAEAKPDYRALFGLSLKY